MELTNAVAILREYNRWRRGEGEDEVMPDPLKIGQAIDTVCDHLGDANKKINVTATPETDALLSDQSFDAVNYDDAAGQLADLARKLERERDAARQALAAIAALPRVEHKYWEESDGHIDESWDESDDGMYLLHYQVAEILREAAK